VSKNNSEDKDKRPRQLSHETTHALMPHEICKAIWRILHYAILINTSLCLKETTLLFIA